MPCWSYPNSGFRAAVDVSETRTFTVGRQSPEGEREVTLCIFGSAVKAPQSLGEALAY